MSVLVRYDIGDDGIDVTYDFCDPAPAERAPDADVDRYQRASLRNLISDLNDMRDGVEPPHREPWPLTERFFKQAAKDAAQATAHLNESLSSHIGSNAYTDDMAAQGMLEFRFYTHGAADMAHTLGCPGCDAGAASRPELAAWFRVEERWQARGEPPRCPARRREWAAGRALPVEGECQAQADVGNAREPARAGTERRAKRPPRARQQRKPGADGQGSMF